MYIHKYLLIFVTYFFSPPPDFGLLEVLHYFTTHAFSLKRVLAYLLVFSMDAWVIKLEFNFPGRSVKEKEKKVWFWHFINFDAYFEAVFFLNN